jgi:NAD(P)-dependent dehydrogenase (short-subunit alcohol dehydrogenase family)
LIAILKVLPLMKERKSGCIICVASRSGSLDLPGGISYSVSKAAVIRAIGCIQMEIDWEGLGNDIHMYALHPGGVLTDMPKSKSSVNR